MRPKPEHLSRAERLDELASILAAGLMRLDGGYATAEHAEKHPDTPEASGLEFPAHLRLTVTPQNEVSPRE